MTDARPISRQCKHIKDNGEQCRKNALPGRSYCNMASHRRAALCRTRIGNFGRRWWPVVTTGFALVVGIPSFYSYSARISVEPVSTIRSHEPMGTVFNVTNTGTFDLHNVTQACDAILPKYGNNSFFGHNRQLAVLGDLPAGRSKSLDCEHLVAGIPGAARAEISITFNSLLWPRTRTATFLFQSEQANDGTWVWKAK
jgi:hypothetical protein